MTKFIIAIAAAAGFALPAVAQETKEADDIWVIMDTDADGAVSKEEAMVYYSNYVSENFDNIDTSNDGFLQSSELKEAEANALFPLSDGND